MEKLYQPHAKTEGIQHVAYFASTKLSAVEKNQACSVPFTKTNDASKQHWGNKHGPVYFQTAFRIMRDVNMNLKSNATRAATLAVSAMKLWQPCSHGDPTCQPELCFRGSRRSCHSGIAVAVAAFSSSIERWACGFQPSPQPASCLLGIRVTSWASPAHTAAPFASMTPFCLNRARVFSVFTLEALRYPQVPCFTSLQGRLGEQREPQPALSRTWPQRCEQSATPW